MEHLQPIYLLKMLNVLLTISTDEKNLDGIQKSGAIPILIRFLERKNGLHSTVSIYLIFTYFFLIDNKILTNLNFIF